MCGWRLEKWVTSFSLRRSRVEPGVITSLVQADGLALIPRGTQGMEAGEQVQGSFVSKQGRDRKNDFLHRLA